MSISLNDAYAVFYKAVSEVNHGGDTPDYTIVSAGTDNPHDLETAAERLAPYFAICPADEDEEGDDFDPLSLDVYKNVRDESQILIEACLVSGGPNIYARYESKGGRLTISLYWGGIRLAVRTNDENLKLYREMRSIADAYRMEC